MLVNAHLYYIVQGHSIYRFRLYLTIQKSPVHIEKLVQLTARRLNRHRKEVFSESGQLCYYLRKNKNEKTQASKQATFAYVLHPRPLHHLPECHSAVHLFERDHRYLSKCSYVWQPYRILLRKSQ